MLFFLENFLNYFSGCWNKKFRYLLKTSLKYLKTNDTSENRRGFYYNKENNKDTLKNT